MTKKQKTTDKCATCFEFYQTLNAFQLICKLNSSIDLGDISRYVCRYLLILIEQLKYRKKSINLSVLLSFYLMRFFTTAMSNDKSCHKIQQSNETQQHSSHKNKNIKQEQLVPGYLKRVRHQVVCSKSHHMFNPVDCSLDGCFWATPEDL